MNSLKGWYWLSVGLLALTLVNGPIASMGARLDTRVPGLLGIVWGHSRSYWAIGNLLGPIPSVDRNVIMADVNADDHDVEFARAEAEIARCQVQEMKNQIRRQRADLQRQALQSVTIVRRSRSDAGQQNWSHPAPVLREPI
jgi:hypothetical protein